MAAKDYDVIVIGSGHSGGMAAYTLTKLGVKVLMLDAGPLVDMNRQRVAKASYELPYRGFGKPGKVPHVYQANESNANQWVDETQVPYTHEKSLPYNWVRVRMIGGKSLFWARMSFRLSDFEFKGKDHDGYGENWPINHAELDPFYSRVEGIYQVAGRKEGLAQLPDGNFIESGRGQDTEYTKKLAEAGKAYGMTVTVTRSSRGRNGLASSTTCTLPDALATGNLTIVPNAVVRHLTVDKATGLVNGVDFVDRQSRREMHLKARAVMVGAACLESTRILLNSGIANSSGALGHYLHDQFYITQSIYSSLPAARDGKTRIAGGGYVPRFRNIKKGKEHNFIRGYAFDFGFGRNMNEAQVPGYGPEVQKTLQHYAGSGFGGTIMGEVLPRYENFVRINKDVKDAFGIPVLHFICKYGENEANMAKDAVTVMSELSEKMGFEVLMKNDKPFPPGYSIHELGTCRMGDNPKTSVLNKWNQAHDVKNLFVIDGSSFVTGGSQNPTMTIVALAMRASEYLVDQSKKGNI